MGNIFELYKKSSVTIKNNIGKIIGVELLFFVISIFMSFILMLITIIPLLLNAIRDIIELVSADINTPYLINNEDISVIFLENIGLFILAMLLFSIIGFLVMSPLNIGKSKMVLDITRNNPIEFGDIFYGYKNYKNSLKVYLLLVLRGLMWGLIFLVPVILISFIIVLMQVDLSGILQSLINSFVSALYAFVLYLYIDSDFTSTSRIFDKNASLREGKLQTLFLLFFLPMLSLELIILIVPSIAPILIILYILVALLTQYAVSNFYVDLVEKT